MKKVLLMILDGWGVAPANSDNAISLANTPNWDELLKTCNNTTIQTSGFAVGLPNRQMGNSEVGHMNIGAGRVVYQSLTRIQKAVAEHNFEQTQALVDACQISDNNALHIIGLLSDGGVHSHILHIIAMINLAKQQNVKNIYFHAILDGRDTAPKSAQEFLNELVKMEDEKFKIASVIGRYYAMDRDNNWDRVVQAYDLFVNAKASCHADSALKALENAYLRGENDEFVCPTVIDIKSRDCSIQNNDSVVMMNFRADRFRQITQAIYEDDFDRFSGFYAKKNQNNNNSREVSPYRKINFAQFVTLTQYQANFSAKVAFPAQKLTNGLGEVLAKHNLKQLRIAETEKYAHVTYFFNGGEETAFAGEERRLIPSPSVATYDLLPEMSAYEVTDNLITAINSDKYSFICVNYANPDMVGHTGVLEAAIKAVEVIDDCIGKVLFAAKQKQISVLITADHGNVEDMIDEQTGQPITSHTMNPVPLVLVDFSAFMKAEKIQHNQLLSGGALCDLAPTVLELLDIEQPAEMTGKSLLI